MHICSINKYNCILLDFLDNGNFKESTSLKFPRPLYIELDIFGIVRFHLYCINYRPEISKEAYPVCWPSSSWNELIAATTPRVHILSEHWLFIKRINEPLIISGFGISTKNYISYKHEKLERKKCPTKVKVVNLSTSLARSANVFYKYKPLENVQKKSWKIYIRSVQMMVDKYYTKNKCQGQNTANHLGICTVDEYFHLLLKNYLGFNCFFPYCKSQ